MGKEHYNVSFKTYFNDRIKPTVFRGEECPPLYIQVIFDREAYFYKSHYFELFSRPKYDFLPITFPQIDKLESGVIDFFIEIDYGRFNLDSLRRHYKSASQDVLDNFEAPFSKWLAAYLKGKGYPGLSALLEFSTDDVCVMRVWDDLKTILDPEIFNEMEEKAMHAGPYMPLATYVRHVSPDGPFCLPYYEWSNEKKQVEIEYFIDERFWRVDFDLIIRQVSKLIPYGGFR